MAARSSAGVGVGITITLLGVACLGLFITTIVFYSKFQRSERELTTNRQEWDTWVRRDEQNGDAVGRIRELAKKDKKSVVGYLNDSMRTTMARVTGRAGDGLEALESELKKIEGADTSNLVSVVHGREASIADLTAKLAESDKARITALENMQAEAERVKTKIAAYDKTVATLNTDIERYKAEVEQYRESVNKAKADMDAREEKLREQFAAKENAFIQQIRKVESENLQLTERLSTYTAAKTKDILKGQPEESLVDGTIVAATAGSNEVTINRGRKDKVVLGMTFAVYANSTSIKAGADGAYPQGKAAIEVISVGEATSTARVVRETKGNPIVRGDSIANAIYDPNKVYTFLVFGNFDTNGDGVATPSELNDIRAMVEAWGGKVTDELSGAVDFLILGQRPVVPPPPGSGAPPAVVTEYMRIDQLATRYDELSRQAAATSVPILNENRLYTLIGRRPGAR
jgi:hypothetical protein